MKSEPFRTFKAKEIARKLNIKPANYRFLKEALRQMVLDGHILRFKKNRFGTGQQASEAVGKLHVNSQGYGFVARDKGDDVFVSQKNMGFALHNDIVRVRLFATYEGKSPEGQIIEIVERTHNTLVGTFRKGKKHSYVIPDDIKIQRDIIISSDDTNGAREKQKVVVQIDDWEDSYLNPGGHVVQVLGYPDEPGVDVLSIIHGLEIPVSFSDIVLTEADNIPAEIPEKELKRRLDLRKKTIFTIDPKEAKDFDDAVSLETLENGTFQLGVHIADVSYYVREKSSIDVEALERGTSVYLVDRVIPMLPERISNQLCSLEEGKDKLCYSVIMQLTSDAELVSYQVRETIIHSSKRFNYQEAQQILNGELESEFAPVLKNMYKLSKILIQKREQRGSINFDSLEVEVELDDEGHPVNLRRRVRLDTHRLVEEFMLLANETVACHVGVKLSQERGDKVPFIYRVHEKPDAVSIDGLLLLAAAFGITMKKPKRITPKYFQRFSEQLSTHPASPVLQEAMLRTMMKAKYTTENAGHFGLAYKHYTHFTSPIRRYPDLMVHRLLKKYFNATKEGFPNLDGKKLEETCKKNSEQEIRAQDAERASIKMKQLEYLERHVGDVFDGVISRIVSFGIFVQISELLIDGLVHVTSLADDYYILDEKNYMLVGQYQNKKYKLGDKVKVQVSRISRNERLVDFILA